MRYIMHAQGPSHDSVEYRCRYGATKVFPCGWLIQHDRNNKARTGSRRIADKCGKIAVLCITVAFRLVRRACLASYPVTLYMGLGAVPPGCATVSSMPLTARAVSCDNTRLPSTAPSSFNSDTGFSSPPDENNV